jgi:hypothetical protein
MLGKAKPTIKIGCFSEEKPTILLDNCKQLSNKN